MSIWIKAIFLYWLSASVVLLAGTYLVWGFDDALSCLAGEIVIGFNLLAMIWAWQRIYSGKGLALAVSVIVFKYAILAFSIYWLIVHKMVSPLGFLVGIGVLLVVVSLLSYKYKSEVLDKLK
jgi:hypothetical protein